MNRQATHRFELTCPSGCADNMRAELVEQGFDSWTETDAASFRQGSYAGALTLFMVDLEAPDPAGYCNARSYEWRNGFAALKDVLEDACASVAGERQIVYAGTRMRWDG